MNVWMGVSVFDMHFEGKSRSICFMISFAVMIFIFKRVKKMFVKQMIFHTAVPIGFCMALFYIMSIS